MRTQERRALRATRTSTRASKNFLVVDSESTDSEDRTSSEKQRSQRDDDEGSEGDDDVQDWHERFAEECGPSTPMAHVAGLFE